jgi:hypothetical protein
MRDVEAAQKRLVAAAPDRLIGRARQPHEPPSERGEDRDDGEDGGYERKLLQTGVRLGLGPDVGVGTEDSTRCFQDLGGESDWPNHADVALRLIG